MSRREEPWCAHRSRAVNECRQDHDERSERVPWNWGADAALVARLAEARFDLEANEQAEPAVAGTGPIEAFPLIV